MVTNCATNDHPEGREEVMVTNCATNDLNVVSEEVTDGSSGEVILNPETAVVDDHGVPPLSALPAIEKMLLATLGSTVTRSRDPARNS